MRTWTLEEATAALPEVQRLVRRLREVAGAARQRRERTRGNGAASGNGHAPHATMGDDTAAELRSVLDQLTERGIVVRDPQRGLIDFPAKSATGRDYLLCFLDGETAIEWWHWPDAGFAGRTPLSEPPP